jgi:predicted nuclease of predicted toxin-antitoxin system
VASASPGTMILLIDECVPDSIADFFRARGHQVYLVRELLGAGSPDPLVAVGGDKLSAIVVTFNDKDFKTLISRRPEPGVKRLGNVGRISFRCTYDRAIQRIEELIESVEFEYGQVQKQRDRRLIIEITTTRLNVIR